MIYEFTEVLFLDSSFGPQSDFIRCNCEAEIFSDKNDVPCGFELICYDENGKEIEEFYVEGGLTVENGVLVDYDGVFALPLGILKALEGLGIDVSEF